MAASKLKPSEIESRRLYATKAQLDQRWAKVGDIIANGIGCSSRDVAVDAEYLASGVWTGLRGSAVECIERHRGRAKVAPFVQLPDDLMAWLGYQEIWDSEGGRRPFTYRQASLTVYVGQVGDPIKPQLLRLEWPGLRDWDGSGVGFQSHGAGHPHWQIDILESLRSEPKAATFDPDAESEVETFEPATTTIKLSDRIRALALENMHLASAAPWWLNSPAKHGMHQLNAPDNHESLSRWLQSAIAYIKQELSRCVHRHYQSER